MMLHNHFEQSPRQMEDTFPHGGDWKDKLFTSATKKQDGYPVNEKEKPERNENDKKSKAWAD